MTKKIILIGLAVLLTGCIQSASDESFSGGFVLDGKTVQFQAEDNFTIVGTLWGDENSSKNPIVLIHQLGRDRHSFDSFARRLFVKGFTVLSIDVRGHGESVKKGDEIIYYTDFVDEDFRKISDDILKAKEFLKAEKILVVGASIGANSALNYSVLDHSSAGIVLLSPGLDYKGIETKESSSQQNVPLFIAASREDAYASQSSQIIFDRGPLADKKLILLENAGHGTDMLVSKRDFEEQVIDWLELHSS